MLCPQRAVLFKQTVAEQCGLCLMKAHWEERMELLVIEVTVNLESVSSQRVKPAPASENWMLFRPAC